MLLYFCAKFIMHPALRGDPQRLDQMLAILVANAIKFSGQGRIELRVRLVETGKDGLLLCFEVADQGIGIDLSICSRLAELMGGKVGVDSTPGAGSTFWFTARLQRGSETPAIAQFERHAAALRAALGAPGERLGHEIRQFAFAAARKTVQTLRLGVPEHRGNIRRTIMPMIPSAQCAVHEVQLRSRAA